MTVIRQVHRSSQSGNEPEASVKLDLLLQGRQRLSAYVVAPIDIGHITKDLQETHAKNDHQNAGHDHLDQGKTLLVR